MFPLQVFYTCTEEPDERSQIRLLQPSLLALWSMNILVTHGCVIPTCSPKPFPCTHCIHRGKKRHTREQQLPSPQSARGKRDRDELNTWVYQEKSKSVSPIQSSNCWLLGNCQFEEGSSYSLNIQAVGQVRIQILDNCNSDSPAKYRSINWYTVAYLFSFLSNWSKIKCALWLWLYA